MIGQMRHKITFKAPTSVPVGGGGTATTYAEVLTDRCEAKQLTSSRDLVEQQTTLTTTYTFKLRWRTGFTPSKSMLITYEGQDYSINSIEYVNERSRFWRITAAVLK